MGLVAALISRDGRYETRTSKVDKETTQPLKPETERRPYG